MMRAVWDIHYYVDGQTHQTLDNEAQNIRHDKSSDPAIQRKIFFFLQDIEVYAMHRVFV
ncbi:hypothetical protein JCM10512_2565 [Bacteroides reticulotermitis JCM 10512]|uniref:Uncharacterized protein n=1 Tax=Bacteroides reticulotermitis JCM 10512 TaxID=1445607 RepID=W4USN8_9BACE|nr:hypothetical protein JCM10512_2565 [Bacteroides reticulotermitis JCM 10512]